MPGRLTHDLAAFTLTLALTLKPEEVRGGFVSSVAALLVTYAVVSATAGRLRGLGLGAFGILLAWFWPPYTPTPWLVKVFKAVEPVSGEYALLILTGLACLAGSRLPDEDLDREHRVKLHNLLAMVGSAFCFLAALVTLNAYASLTLNERLAFKLSKAMLAGYGLHLAFDALTPTGVALLYPFSGRMIRVARLKWIVTPLTLLTLLALAYAHWATSQILVMLVNLLTSALRLLR